MLDDIKVPKSVNHMQDTNLQVRHLKKMSLLIGVPILIVVIIISVYFYSLQPRLSASKITTQPQTDQSSNTVETGVNSILPAQNQALLPNKDLNTEEYKKYFERLNLNLVKYDSLYQDIKINGQCYSSATENINSRNSWILSINSILDQKIPEITSNDTLGQETADQSNQLKGLTNSYTAEIKNFIESDKKAFENRVNLIKVLFKICDGSIDQIETNCKDLPVAVDNYKKSFSSNLNEELVFNLDSVLKYCNQIQDIVKSDNEGKFNELNSTFGANYSKIVSIYPNLEDKINTIKDLRDKITKSLI